MLSRYSDAWFMSESLAFYLSTNTFNNPVFDEQLAADLCLDQRQPSSREKVDKLESRLGARCSQLCDSLVFSLKSKIFVLELNFKRSLRRLRSFADRQRLRLVPGSSAWSASSQWARRKRVGDRAGVEQTPWMHRTLSSADESKFWRKMDDSRAPLDAQKERILSRLEQVVQAKRMSEQNAHLKLNHLQLIRQSRVSHASDISDKESAPKEDPAVACQLGKQTNECATNTNGAHQSGSATPTLPLLPGRRVTKQGWQSGWRLKPRQIWAGSCHQAYLHKGSSLSSPEIKDQDPKHKLCVVCYSNSPNIVTIPCKHDQICSDCFIEIIYMTVKHNQYPLRCVLCRQKVERIRCSKKLLLRVIEKNRVCS